MSSELRAIQITDFHVSADPDAIYRGINPRRNLESVLGRVRRWKPDLLLLTGDLSEDGSEQSYRYLGSQVHELGVPALAVPGNHDDWGMQKKYFPLSAIEEPFVSQHSGWQLILLNSSVRGQIAGTLTQSMISGLNRSLSDSTAPKLIALHHQPLLTGSPWIDRYSLQDPEGLMSCLDGRDDVKAVLWGHIHHDFSAHYGQTRLLGSPSSSANSLARQDKFNFDPAGPACRWLKLGRNGKLETGILYANS